VHLPGIGVSELAELQINDDKAPQAAVIEEEVYPVPFVANSQSALPSDKGEVAAEFQKEVLKLQYQGFFQVVLEYCLSPRNSRTKGSLISSSGVTASSGKAFSPFLSIAALFLERASGFFNDISLT
jgi:hypothetical protein